MLQGTAALAAVGFSGSAFLGSRRAAWAAAGDIFDDDRILGVADAPITIIEYSSLTCPHCATFHEDPLPQIKENWIDAGKARLVFRHFPLDGLALRAAAISNCFEGERFFAFLDLLFKSQSKWARADDPLAALARYARLAGLSQEDFDRCLADESEMNRILERVQDGKTTYQVRATPTLIVNGKVYEGRRTYSSFETLFKNLAPES
jgi:protein-disulfide isomerase